MKLAAVCLVMIAAAAPAMARERQVASAATLDSYVLPNPLLTPCRINPAASLDVICSTMTKARRNFTRATRAKVLRDYNQRR